MIIHERNLTLRHDESLSVLTPWALPDRRGTPDRGMLRFVEPEPIKLPLIGSSHMHGSSRSFDGLFLHTATMCQVLNVKQEHHTTTIISRRLSAGGGWQKTSDR